MKVQGYLVGAALALAACVRVDNTPDMITVSDVQVEADLTAVSGRNAAVYWGNLTSDLSTAIAQEFVGQTADDGWVVAVDIDEISLASVFASPVGDQARLTGAVALLDPASGDVERTYAVSASANEAAPFLPPGTDVVTLSPTSAEFYGAVVRAFASGVADTLRAGPPPIAS